MKRHFALLAALLLAARAGNAEVRLKAGAGGPELSVEVVADRIWMPSGVPDALTVNPEGDLLGDGFPAQATGRGHLVAAWQRPARSAVVVLRASTATDSTSVEVAADDVVGTPIVTSLDSGALVAWQTGTVNPEVKAVVAADGGVSTPISIISGRLLDVYRVGDSIHVVAFDALGRSLNIGTIPASYVPSPIPIGVERVPLLRTFGAVPLEATPPPEFVTSPEIWLPCVDKRGTDVLLAWQAGRSVIGRVVLDAYGVEGAGEFFRGPNGSCQAVLNAASRR